MFISGGYSMKLSVRGNKKYIRVYIYIYTYIYIHTYIYGENLRGFWWPRSSEIFLIIKMIVEDIKDASINSTLHFIVLRFYLYDRESNSLKIFFSSYSCISCFSLHYYSFLFFHYILLFIL